MLCAMWQTGQGHTVQNSNIFAQVEPQLPPYFRALIPTESRDIMPYAPGLDLTSHRSKQRPSGAPEARSRAPQDGRSPTMALGIYQYGNKSLLDMPLEIIEAILIMWTMVEWFAPAIARRICRSLKVFTDSSPRVWSKLFLPNNTPATADSIRKWLTHAKAASKEILLETEDIRIILAALKGVEDATSLIYRTPYFKDILPLQQDQIRLPIHMPRLRHLHLETSNMYDFTGLSNIFGLKNSPSDAHFPCLNTMHLVSVDLTGFRIMPGSFPVMRRLVLNAVCGPSLDLIDACSGSLEDLRVILCFSDDRQLAPHDRVCLANLKVLIVDDALGFEDDALGIVSEIEAPNLRLICADLDEVDGSTGPFRSVVEWANRQSPVLLQETDITGHLINMPQLQHLILFRHMETVRRCFEALRDDPRICPELQSIEVVDFADTYPKINLGTDFKDFLKACVARRVEKVPGFILQFVDNDVQVARLRQYYTIDVRLFILIHPYSSYHASRRALARSKAR
jgi:hypothetical protein